MSVGISRLNTDVLSLIARFLRASESAALCVASRELYRLMKWFRDYTTTTRLYLYDSLLILSPFRRECIRALRAFELETLLILPTFLPLFVGPVVCTQTNFDVLYPVVRSGQHIGERRSPGNNSYQCSISCQDYEIILQTGPALFSNCDLAVATFVRIKRARSHLRYIPVFHELYMVFRPQKSIDRTILHRSIPRKINTFLFELMSGDALKVLTKLAVERNQCIRCNRKMDFTFGCKYNPGLGPRCFRIYQRAHRLHDTAPYGYQKTAAPINHTKLITMIDRDIENIMG